MSNHHTRSVLTVQQEVTLASEVGIGAKDREVDTQCLQDEYLSVKARVDKGQHC